MKAIKYTRGSLEILNQKLLPGETVFEDSSTTEKTFAAIREMKVRGAPAIAISALLGLAAEVHAPLLALRDSAADAPPAFRDLAAALATLTAKLGFRHLSRRPSFCPTADHLLQSRPTAVNLGNAVSECKEHLAKKHAELANGQDGTGRPEKRAKLEEAEKAAALLESFIGFAEEYHDKDVAINRAISKFGSEYILQHCSQGRDQVRMLTHCNTGALATTQYGTALGVIRFLHEAKALERVYCTETRPYNQGARLTAYECVHEGMQTTLVVDSSVSYLMAQGMVHAVVVGADRVCNNGDTANKVGTYQVAIGAKYHNVPFFVCVPTTTLDLSLADGSLIHIEQRPSEEVTHNAQTGHRVVVESELLSVWNPSFDVTPASLISGIITERGVIVPDEHGKYDISAWLKAHP